MLGTLSQHWWILAIRGVIAALFAILAFVRPGVSLWVLVYLSGIFVLLDSIFALVTAFGEHRTNDRWWILLLEGLAGVIMVIAFTWPGMTALTLLYFIAAWAIMIGSIEIWSANRLYEGIEGEWVLALSGLASIIFGALMILWPNAGARAVIWLIAAYAIFFSILLFCLAFRVRNRGVEFRGQIPHAT